MKKPASTHDTGSTTLKKNIKGEKLMSEKVKLHSKLRGFRMQYLSEPTPGEK